MNKHGSMTMLCMALCAVPQVAIAQIDVQAPGVRLEASAGAVTSSDYRDFVIDKAGSGFAAGSIATRGFSVSGWVAWGSVVWREALVGYSLKLPIVDAHVAYVSSKAPYGLGGEFVRFTLTSNNSESTVISLSTDLRQGRASLTNIRGTHAFASHDGFQPIVSASVTRAHGETGAKVGHSVRFHLLHPIAQGTLTNAYVGYVSGRVSPAAPTSGAVCGLSVVHTF
jgi:hypothetical protein